MLARVGGFFSSSFRALGKPLTRDRPFLVLYLALSALYLAPVVMLRHLPMQDGPAHLALIQIWRHLDDPGVIQQEYMARGGLPPYVVYYSLLRLLGALTDLETANRFILAGYVIALPLSFAYTFTRFGRDMRYGLLAFPFIYNTPFIYGFTSNVIALPLFVLAIGLTKSYLDRPNWRRELTLTVLIMVLYLSHVLVAAAYAVSAPILLLSHVHRPLQVLRRGLFGLPAFALALWWSQGQTKGTKFEGEHFDVSQNLREGIAWINDVQLGNWDEYALLAVFATVLLCAALPSPPLTTPRRHWTFALAAVAVFALFFAAPAHTFKPYYHWATNSRLVLPGVFLLLLLPKLPLRGARLLLLAPALIVFTLSGFELYQSFTRYDATLRHLDRVIEAIPANKRVLPLVYDQGDGLHRGYPIRHTLLLYQAQKPGYMPEGLVSDNTPIAFRTRRTPGPFYKRPGDFRYNVHGSYYHYFLAAFPEGRPPPDTLPTAGANLRLVRRSGRFAAYENLGPRPAG
ncbi:MAG: hypothetical protein R3B13_17450 [Polyangiaceae bacterium]